MAVSSQAAIGWCLPLLAFVLSGCGSHESQTERRRQGFEPRFCGSEPYVLPFYDLPT